jgi:hypothetical protein
MITSEKPRIRKNQGKKFLPLSPDFNERIEHGINELI